MNSDHSRPKSKTPSLWVRITIVDGPTIEALITNDLLFIKPWESELTMRVIGELEPWSLPWSDIESCLVLGVISPKMDKSARRQAHRMQFR